jgi:hypothetical protein
MASHYFKTYKEQIDFHPSKNPHATNATNGSVFLDPNYLLDRYNNQSIPNAICFPAQTRNTLDVNAGELLLVECCERRKMGIGIDIDKQTQAFTVFNGMNLLKTPTNVDLMASIKVIGIVNTAVGYKVETQNIKKDNRSNIPVSMGGTTNLVNTGNCQIKAGDDLYAFVPSYSVHKYDTTSGELKIVRKEVREIRNEIALSYSRSGCQSLLANNLEMNSTPLDGIRLIPIVKPMKRNEFFRMVYSNLISQSAMLVHNQLYLQFIHRYACGDLNPSMLRQMPLQHKLRMEYINYHINMAISTLTAGAINKQLKHVPENRRVQRYNIYHAVDEVMDDDKKLFENKIDYTENEINNFCNQLKSKLRGGINKRKNLEKDVSSNYSRLLTGATDQINMDNEKDTVKDIAGFLKDYGRVKDPNDSNNGNNINRSRTISTLLSMVGSSYTANQIVSRNITKYNDLINLEIDNLGGKNKNIVHNFEKIQLDYVNIMNAVNSMFENLYIGKALNSAGSGGDVNVLIGSK